MPEAAIIMISIGVMVGLFGALPTLAGAWAERIKNAQRNENSKEMNARLERLEKMVHDLAQTRETSLQHSMSVEQNYEMLQSRMAHLEKQVSEQTEQTEQTLNVRG